MTITITHHKRISQTPAIPLLVRGWAEISAASLTNGGICIAWDHEALVALVDDTPAGVLSYNFSEWQNCFWVNLGYVLPEYRKQGVYRALWAELITRAQTAGALTIEGSTHVDNKALQRVASKLGRAPSSITYTFAVPAAKPAPANGAAA